MKFRISIAENLLWPQKCAYCGKDASYHHSVYGKQYAGYSFKVLWHEFKYKQLSVEFPVCGWHSFVSFVLPPIQIIDVELHYFTLVINNPVYGIEFSNLNSIEPFLW